MILFAIGLASSQSPAPGFEVVSIRTVRDDARMWALRQLNPARYRSLSNVMQLITWAWKIQNYQVEGAALWLSQERFEIQAATGHPSNVDEERIMVRRLLADRFGLRVHLKSKEIAVYALLVGANGPKLAVAKQGSAPPAHRGINIVAGVLTAFEARWINSSMY